MSNSNTHKYYANAIGFCGFFALLIFVTRSCDSLLVEKEKTKQIEIIHNCKNKK